MLVRSLLPATSGGHAAGEAVRELADVLSEAERSAILRALSEADDSKVEAVRLLGIGERTLWTKLKKHGL